MANVIITYNSSALVDAGWRSIEIKAKAELSETGKMAKVVEVISIDDEVPEGYISRTGAKRQTYNASSIAKREVGVNKRVSSLLTCDGIDYKRV